MWDMWVSTPYDQSAGTSYGVQLMVTSSAVQMPNVVDTSIKCAISGQSFHMVKCCMDMCYDNMIVYCL